MDGVLEIEGRGVLDDVIVRITFESVLVVRICDEGVRIRLSQNDDCEHALMLSQKDSDISRWVADEGLNTRDMSAVNSYIIFIGEEVLDVVTSSSPVVNWFD
ncbi:hypothetical protein HF319_01905 [Xanthomonas sp. Kuri4-1]